MDRLKKEIYQKILAQVVADWCRRNPKMIFQESLCSHEGHIRFTTDILHSIFPKSDKSIGFDKSGEALLYEIQIATNRLTMETVLYSAGIPKKQIAAFESILAEKGNDRNVIKRWQYPLRGKSETDEEALSDFTEVELPYFETQLLLWQADHTHKIAPFPEIELTRTSRDDLPQELLIEGASKEILCNKFERNIKARRRCIAANGTACKICGFDFGEVYGPEFAGKIEVHHIVPLNEIREDYVVDPIHDLIPVCPNCHMVLHSKPNGVFSVDEITNRLYQKKGIT